jgi:hypothetical protein
MDEGSSVDGRLGGGDRSTMQRPERDEPLPGVVQGGTRGTTISLCPHKQNK